MNEDLMYVTSPIIVLREESDDWGILFDPDTGNIIGINPVGVAIWKLLDGTHSFNDILTRIESEFECKVEQIRDDIETFINGLLEQRAIGLKAV